MTTTVNSIDVIGININDKCPPDKDSTGTSDQRVVARHLLRHFIRCDLWVNFAVFTAAEFSVSVC